MANVEGRGMVIGGRAGGPFVFPKGKAVSFARTHPAEFVQCMAMPLDGWQFLRWEHSSPNILTGTDVAKVWFKGQSAQSESLTAVFVPALPVELDIEKVGEGQVSPEAGHHTLGQGDLVILEATPADGWLFDRWECDGCAFVSTRLRAGFIIEEDMSIRAVFKKNALLLTHVIGDGYVLRAPQGVFYPQVGTPPEDAVVRLEAVANADADFVQWEGSGVAYATSALTNPLPLDNPSQPLNLSAIWVVMGPDLPGGTRSITARFRCSCGCGAYVEQDDGERCETLCGEACVEVDLCPDNPDKMAPGACGCEAPDTDSDGDWVPDCDDGCPDVPGKSEEGDCGCYQFDIDNDGDGTPNCNDQCPFDPFKTQMGTCDCYTPDIDTDGDGKMDCEDGCPTDPSRTLPGYCGCNTDVIDTDGDGVFDCDDYCPLDPLNTCLPPPSGGGGNGMIAWDLVVQSVVEIQQGGPEPILTPVTCDCGTPQCVLFTNIIGCDEGVGTVAVSGVPEFCSRTYHVAGESDTDVEYTLEVEKCMTANPTQYDIITLFKRWEGLPELSSVSNGGYHATAVMSGDEPRHWMRAIFDNHTLRVEPALPDGRTFLLPGENLEDFVSAQSTWFEPELPENVQVVEWSKETVSEPGAATQTVEVRMEIDTQADCDFNTRTAVQRVSSAFPDVYFAASDDSDIEINLLWYFINIPDPAGWEFRVNRTENAFPVSETDGVLYEDFGCLDDCRHFYAHDTDARHGTAYYYALWGRYNNEGWYQLATDTGTRPPHEFDRIEAFEPNFVPAAGTFGSNPTEVSPCVPDWGNSGGVPRLLYPQWPPALIIWYRYVKNPSNPTVPFAINIDLSAITNDPNADHTKYDSMAWTKLAGPNVGTWGTLSTIDNRFVQRYQFADAEAKGGLYKFQLSYAPNPNECVSSVNVLLPLAGGSINTWLREAIKAMPAFYQEWASYCMATYPDETVLPSAVMLFEAFCGVSSTYFDYLGTSDVADGSAPTRRYSYNFAESAQEKPTEVWCPSYATLSGVVVFRPKINNILWAVFCREFGFTELEIRAGAHFNSLSRLRGLDNPSSQHGLEIGFYLYDILQTDPSNFDAAYDAYMTAELASGLQTDLVNDLNLWPCEQEGDGFEAPDLLELGWDDVYGTSFEGVFDEIWPW